MEYSQDPLTGNGDILVVSSVVRPFCLDCYEKAVKDAKPSEKVEPHEKIGFLTPRGIKIDYIYNPYESPVMMTKDGHGLSYLGHLFGQLKKSPNKIDFKDPKEFENNEPFDSYEAVISIGSHLSNSVTARIMDQELPQMHPDQIEFQFTELKKETPWDRIACHQQEGISQLKFFPLENPGDQGIFDYGAIVSFKNHCTNFFVLSGLGPLGVRAACDWFSTKYTDRNHKRRHQNNPYYQIIRVRRDQGQGERPSEVEFSELLKPVVKKRFAVALSFPGEHRSYVEEIAEVLSTKLSKDRIFYDKYHEGMTTRLNLDTYLQEIYIEETELIVVMLCNEYSEKEWCGLEFRAIRDLIKKKQNDVIMPLKVGGGNVKDIIDKVEGILSIDNVTDTQDRSAADVAQLILDRYATLQSRNS